MLTSFPLRHCAALLLVLLAVAGLRLVWLTAYGVTWSPDSHEYFNIARNLAEGRGYVLDIKFHYYRPFPVSHAAWGERPPLYPLLLSWLMRAAGAGDGLFHHCPTLHPDNSGDVLFQANTLFAVLAAAAAYVLVLRLTRSGFIAALGTLLVSLHPWIFDNSLGLHTETPLLLFTYLFVLALPAADAAPRRWLLCGVLAGLAGLLRGNGLLLLAAAVVYLLLRRRQRALPQLAALVIPYLLLAAIIPVNTYQTQGEAFYDIHSSHYCLPAYDLAIWQGFEYDYPKPAAFIAGNLPLVLRGWAGNAVKYAYDFCLPWLFLFFLPLMVGVNWRGDGSRHLFVLVVAALLNYTVLVSFWSVYAPRFLIPVLGLLIPVALRALAPDGFFFRALPATRHGRVRALLLFYLVFVLGAFAWQDLQQVAGYIRRTRQGPHAPAVYAALYRTLPHNAVVGATDPWVVANAARVPAAIMPEFRDRAQFARWAKQYGITHLVIDTEYTAQGRDFLTRFAPALCGAELLFGPVHNAEPVTGRLRLYVVPPA